jgi:hypothetical protein
MSRALLLYISRYVKQNANPMTVSGNLKEKPARGSADLLIFPLRFESEGLRVSTMQYAFDPFAFPRIS